MEKIEWNQILESWKEREADEFWKDFYQARGFESWEDWRWAYIHLMRLPKREWRVETLEDPVEFFRNAYCNALTGWKKFYKERSRSRFEDLAGHPFFEKDHEKIQGIRSNFPPNSQIIALKKGQKTLIVEGHHRAYVAANTAGISVPPINLVWSETELHSGEFDDLFDPSTYEEARNKALRISGLVRAQVKKVVPGLFQS